MHLFSLVHAYIFTCINFDKIDKVDKIDKQLQLFEIFRDFYDSEVRFSKKLFYHRFF